MFSGGYREAVDVWATGVLIYKLVTGRTPFECQYLHETIQNIRSAEVEFTSEFKKYSREMKVFLSKLLERNPEKRPSPCCCLKEVWLSSLRSSTAQREESKKNDKKLCVDRK